MTTHDKDKIIAAAKEAGFRIFCFNSIDGDDVAVGNVAITDELERFYIIAFKAGVDAAVPKAFEAGRQAERESINQDDGTIDWRGENEV